MIVIPGSLLRYQNRVEELEDSSGSEKRGATYSCTPHLSKVLVASIIDPPSLGGHMKLTRSNCADIYDISYINTTHRQNRMTRMTGPDCAVMCNFLHTHHIDRIK